MTILNVLRASWMRALRIGLYQNDFTPFRGMLLSQLEVCTFSGYIGLRTLTSWFAPIITGTRAITEAPPVDWTHSGGPVSNWVYGYYVLDVDGTLRWAARAFPDPLDLSSYNIAARVVPRFSLRSEFS